MPTQTTVRICHTKKYWMIAIARTCATPSIQLVTVPQPTLLLPVALPLLAGRGRDAVENGPHTVSFKCTASARLSYDDVYPLKPSIYG